MDRSVPPLITRLRRRLLTVAWIGVAAILFKIGLATACFGDGAQADANAAPAAAAMVKAIAADVADDGSATACWHAGNSSCHCSCTHGSALPVAAVALPSLQPDGAALPLQASSPPVAPREPALRPPIA
jgi:hypothetical protein